ncbi:Exostosin domain-containing protein [Durusdinium trenchii]|uniref:Exostosin domain-containing protein n=1 Tax=Durusdinium trenchii TaxID=1381693 RepID=A0ABP0NH75_9DINO
MATAGAPLRLSDLTNFFSLEKARAILVSDVKLDDTLCLWTFLMQNFRRPTHHQVEIDLYVTGIQDSAAAVRLARHISDSVREAVKVSGRSLCNLSFRALASRRPARNAPRHEMDTYAPYRDGSLGFPPADEQLLFWEDLPKEARSVDFVGVIAQFFNFEVVNDKGEMSEDILDFIVPNRGGVLAFQSGFNTQVPSNVEEALWQTLSRKVQKAGAKMVFISNRFSFDKASGRPGNAPPDASFLKTLLQCDAKLWSHLRDAGLKESTRFAVDQMAKWLTATEMPGGDYSKNELGSGLAGIKAKYEICEGSPQQVSEGLLKRFLKSHADEAQDQNAVLAACRDLQMVVSTACGPEVADYLGRAVANLEKFGQTLECTDGQHFAVLMQTEVALLYPCKLLCDGPMQPHFLEDAGSECVSWAARGVNVPQALGWLENAVSLEMCP